MNILIFIIILFVLVVAHESGHFFSAKFFGIRVDEFGFGWPPKIFSFKKGETEYSFNLLPIGGFVKIFGEDPNDENTRGPDAARSFVNKPKSQQAVVLLAGVVANFLLAWLLFSFGLMSGLPMSVGSQPSGFDLHNINLTIVNVAKGSPAEMAGLKVQDKIVIVRSGKEFLSPITSESFQNFVITHGNEEIEIGYFRGNDPVPSVDDIVNGSKDKINFVQLFPTAFNNAEEKPAIGVAIDEIGFVKLPVIDAFVEGMKTDWNVTKGTVSGLYNLIADGVRGKGSLSSVSGPVGMVGIVGDAHKFGFAYLLSFAAIISVNLAIINLIPFPALDGGRLLFLLIEKIKGSRMNPKIANTANIIGFAILILLMLLVTYHDIVNLI